MASIPKTAYYFYKGQVILGPYLITGYEATKEFFKYPEGFQRSDLYNILSYHPRYSMGYWEPHDITGNVFWITEELKVSALKGEEEIQLFKTQLLLMGVPVE